MDAVPGGSQDQLIFWPRGKVFSTLRNCMTSDFNDQILSLEHELSKEADYPVQIRSNARSQLSKLFFKMRTKWKEAKANENYFLQKNDDWLNVDVSFPVHSIDRAKYLYESQITLEPTEVKVELPMETTEDSPPVDDQPSTNCTPLLSSSKRVKTSRNKLTAFQARLLKILEKTPAPEVEDVDKSFLLSILPKMKQLNDSDNLQFQMHVLRFFVDLNKNSVQSQVTIHQSFPAYPAYTYQAEQDPFPSALSSPSIHYSDESGDVKPFL